MKFHHDMEFYFLAQIGISFLSQLSLCSSCAALSLLIVDEILFAFNQRTNSVQFCFLAAAKANNHPCQYINFIKRNKPTANLFVELIMFIII